MNTSYTYTTTSTNLTTEQQAAVFGVALSVAVVAVIVAIALYIYTAIALSKMFKKAGINGWIAWVPFYNSWKFFEMGNFHGALSLISLGSSIPVIGIIPTLASLVLVILAMNNIGKGFGKKGSFTVLGVLLPVIWFGILGFGKDKWSGKMYKKSSTPPAAPSTPTTPTTPTPTAPTPPSAA